MPEQLHISPPLLVLNEASEQLFDRLTKVDGKLLNPSGVLYFSSAFPDQNPRFSTVSLCKSQAQSMDRSAGKPVLVIVYNDIAMWASEDLAALAAENIVVLVLSDIEAPGGGGGLGYAVYTALISQFETDAPTVVVLGTNSVGTIVWSRQAAGTYRGTLNGAFPSNKTALFITPTDTADDNLLYFKRISSDVVEIKVGGPEATGADGYLDSTTIEIRVYP